MRNIQQLHIQKCLTAFFFLSCCVCSFRKWQLRLFHSFWPLIMVGQSPASFGCTGSVTDFSQQGVCHADLFISLNVSVDYQRNELNRLHREVFMRQPTQSTHYCETWQGRNMNIKLLTICNTGSLAFWNSFYAVAVDSWLGIIKNRFRSSV